MARLEITSLAFMFDCVPEPVCQTTSGKCSSSLPSMTSWAAATMASPSFGSSRPSSMLASAAARLTMPSARTTRQRLLLPADLEIAERALGLRAPVAVGGHFDRPERVGFGPGLPLALCHRAGSPTIRRSRLTGPALLIKERVAAARRANGPTCAASCRTNRRLLSSCACPWCILDGCDSPVMPKA